MFLLMSEPVPNPKQILYIRPKYTLKLSVACPQQQQKIITSSTGEIKFWIWWWHFYVFNKPIKYLVKVITFVMNEILTVFSTGIY